MKYKSGSFYHIHNCGNNNKQIFYSRKNYLYFLEKVHRFIFPVCEILSYNLMPNDFDFLIYSNDKTIRTIRVGMQEKNVLSEGIRIALSSYSQGVNRMANWNGSIFRQNTRSKELMREKDHLASICFHYLHQRAWE